MYEEEYGREEGEMSPDYLGEDEVKEDACQGADVEREPMVRLIARYPLALMLPSLVILLVYPLEIVRVGFATEVISSLLEKVMEAKGGLELAVEDLDARYVIGDEAPLDRAIVREPGEAEED